MLIFHLLWKLINWGTSEWVGNCIDSFRLAPTVSSIHLVLYYTYRKNTWQFGWKPYRYVLNLACLLFSDSKTIAVYLHYSQALSFSVCGMHWRRTRLLNKAPDCYLVILLGIRMCTDCAEYASRRRVSGNMQVDIHCKHVYIACVLGMRYSGENGKAIVWRVSRLNVRPTCLH